MNANIFSQALQLRNMYGYAIQAFWTGTPTGTIKLQGSCDPWSPAPFIPTNWSDLDQTSLTISNAGNELWNVFDVMYNWVRFVYIDASGGTSNAILTSAVFNGKGI